MGAPITAVALLETTLVSIAITNIKMLSMAGIGKFLVAATINCAMKRAPPVFVMATPRARLETIIIMI